MRKIAHTGGKKSKKPFVVRYFVKVEFDPKRREEEIDVRLSNKKGAFRDERYAAFAVHTMSYLSGAKIVSDEYLTGDSLSTSKTSRTWKRKLPL